jgi:citronellol/citronellal dehydrogenase
VRIDGAASLGTPIYPLVDHDNSRAYNGFHRAFIPDVLKGKQ